MTTLNELLHERIRGNRHCRLGLRITTLSLAGIIGIYAFPGKETDSLTKHEVRAVPETQNQRIGGLSVNGLTIDYKHDQKIPYSLESFVRKDQEKNIRFTRTQEFPAKTVTAYFDLEGTLQAIPLDFTGEEHEVKEIDFGGGSLAYIEVVEGGKNYRVMFR